MLQGEFMKSMLNDKIFIRAMTELWEMEKLETRLIAPTVPYDAYSYGFGLFLVDIGYCSKT